MSEEFVAENAATVETAQTPFATGETAGGPADTGADGQRPTANGQGLPGGAETARVFSQRLKEMSAKQVNAFVAGMGLVDPYRNNRPISTPQDYAAWRAAAHSGAQAMAPGDAVGPEDGAQGGEGVTELARLQDELQQLRSAEWDRNLLADPEQGPIYAGLRDKVQQLLRYPGQDGRPLQPDAAYAAVLLREMPSLQKQAAANARQQALATVQANGQASPGALAGPAADDAPDFERMSSSEFAEYHRRALRGEWV